MLLSDTHRFAFIHVPKTAGSSVHVALGHLSPVADAYWANHWLAQIGIPVNRFAPWPSTKLRPHASAATLRAWLPRDVFDGLFKFAFVRNPWDLLVSYWHYLQRAPNHRRGRFVRSLPSFARYVEYEIHRGRISQSRLLCDRDGELLVDFVGRYESLAADFAVVCRRIGVEASLPRVNASGHDDYREHYNPSLAARVGEAFAADIERFGYSFDTGDASENPLGRRAAA
jgi:hypothetical protein